MTPIVVVGRQFDEDDLVPLTADSPELLIEAAREAIAEGIDVLIRTDQLDLDEDQWMALMSTLIVEGVAAVETEHAGRVRDARRLFDVYAAIAAGDAEAGAASS